MSLCAVVGLMGAATDPAAAQGGQPEWSPNGEWIAFQSSRAGSADIYLMRPDGTEVQRLTSHPSTDQHPSWTPDGQWILFDSDRSGDAEIYIMRRDGSELRRLTRSERPDLVPRVSPAGDRIAFNSQRDRSWDVFVMALDGSGPVNVTRHPATDIVRSWSRSGLVQFDSDRAPNDDGNRDGYLVAPDGSGLVRLTNDAYDNRFLRRGPPGTDRVAFTSTRGGTRGIYTIAPDGSDLRVVYDGPGDDQFPAWSPDGTYLAFSSDESGERHVHRIRVDGTDHQILTKPRTARSERVVGRSIVQRRPFPPTISSRWPRTPWRGQAPAGRLPADDRSSTVTPATASDATRAS